MTRQHGLLALALIFAAIYLFPLYWMYITSVKTASEVFANPPTFWPHDPDLTVFATVWVRRSVPGFMWNSGVTAITVLLGTGLACVLARYRNMWVDVGLFAVLMLQVLPASVMVTPLFVVLVRATFLTVPRALKEAALVDGNSRPGAFFNIVLPLARNGVLVCAILTFMSAFGDYIYSKSIIQETNLQPASVGPDLGGAEMTAQIALSGINKFFGGYHALRDIDLTIAKGGFVALVGPSGCGKSTLLRTIAGLESITSGSIQIAGHIAGHDLTAALRRDNAAGRAITVTIPPTEFTGSARRMAHLCWGDYSAGSRPIPRPLQSRVGTETAVVQRTRRKPTKSRRLGQAPRKGDRTGRTHTARQNRARRAPAHVRASALP